MLIREHASQTNKQTSQVLLVGTCLQVHEQSSEASSLFPQALGLYGNWLAESKSENPNTIIENYLEKVSREYITTTITSIIYSLTLNIRTYQCKTVQASKFKRRAKFTQPVVSHGTVGKSRRVKGKTTNFLLTQLVIYPSPNTPLRGNECYRFEKQSGKSPGN